MNKVLSEKQVYRQRERVNGRYTKMNHCDRCDVFVGDDYWSAPDTDTTGMDICLCKKCYDKYYGKTKEEIIFFKMIDKYNNDKDYRTHYVDLGKGMIMLISFDNSWSYSVYKLEKVSQ